MDRLKNQFSSVENCQIKIFTHKTNLTVSSSFIRLAVLQILRYKILSFSSTAFITLSIKSHFFSYRRKVSNLLCFTSYTVQKSFLQWIICRLCLMTQALSSPAMQEHVIYIDAKVIISSDEPTRTKRTRYHPSKARRTETRTIYWITLLIDLANIQSRQMCTYSGDPHALPFEHTWSIRLSHVLQRSWRRVYY